MSSGSWMKCPVIIPYFGGKFELSQYLVPMLHKHNRYIEMFAGGLSMFFRKPRVDWNIVNDFDGDVVNLYESVRTNFDEFAHHVYWMVKSRERFLHYRDEVIHKKEKINIPDPERAAMYYYVIKNAFNRNVNATIGKDSRSWRTNLLDDVDYSRKLLDNILIENLDFRMLVEKYPPRKEDMWYLDPPYIIAGERKDYYFFEFGMKEHEDLLGLCQQIDNAGGKFMVSYDDRDIVKEMYKDYNIEILTTTYSGSHETKNELVIMNYEPVKIQQSLF